MPKAKWKFAIGKTAGDLAAKTEAEKPVDVYMAVKAARLKEIEVSIGCPASTLSYCRLWRGMDVCAGATQAATLHVLAYTWYSLG